MAQNKAEAAQPDCFLLTSSDRQLPEQDTGLLPRSDETVQHSLFQPDAKQTTTRRTPPPVAQVSDATPFTKEYAQTFSQTGMFEETEKPTERTIENCRVELPPVISQVNGKREWVCTFSAPPDLWHQDRHDLVHARTQTPELITMARKAALQQGDMVTVRGIVTLEKDVLMQSRDTHLTYLNVTHLLPGLRAANTKIHGRTSSNNGRR